MEKPGTFQFQFQSRKKLFVFYYLVLVPLGFCSPFYEFIPIISIERLRKSK